MLRSVGGRGQCWDNAVAESFFVTIKTELLDRRSWPARTVARTAIFEWIEGWYNTRRRHSTLGYLSPAAYEATAYSSRPLAKVACINLSTLSVESGQAHIARPGCSAQPPTDYAITLA
ncbi:integrase core domain-containing protein [Micromonospora echinospora]|uniref:integrase core domain-containing protein n=1 Tax=Micromonospora echinospora TaxID=1877 RepID=UPI003A85173D